MKLENTLSSVKSVEKEYKSKIGKPVSIDELVEFIPDDLSKTKLQKILRSLELITTNQDQELAHGDIIFDEKNYEFGVVLSKKPLAEEDFDKGLKHGPFILLTLSVDENDQYMFRVRYTYPKHIRRIKPTDYIKGKGNSEITEDMKQFCTNQCIMDCGEDCALFKYTRKNGKDNS